MLEKTTLTALAQRPMRLDRIIITGSPIIPRWLSLFVRLFRWVRLPWWERDWDEEERIRFVWARPACAFFSRRVSRLNRASLASVFVHGIQVDNVELLVDPDAGVSAELFSQNAFDNRLQAPAGTRVTLTLSGMHKGVQALALLRDETGMMFTMGLRS